MVKSNEFYGATLFDAVSKATAAYRHEPVAEAKSFCSDLRDKYDRKRSKLDQIQRDIGDLKKKIDDLERAATRANLLALAAAAGTAANAAVKWRGIINLLRRFKLDKEALNAILRNRSEAAAAATALLGAFFGFQDNKEADRLKQEAGRLQARSDDAIAQMEDLAQSYINGNCHLRNLRS